MSKTTITINLPEEFGPDMIAKVAKLRKNKNRAQASQRQQALPVDDKLSDEEFLKAGILNDIVEDYKTMVKSEAMQKAGQEAVADLDKKLAGKK